MFGSFTSTDALRSAVNMEGDPNGASSMVVVLPGEAELRSGVWVITKKLWFSSGKILL